jgi:hypothetical protein
MRGLALLFLGLCSSVANAQQFESVSRTVGLEMVEAFAENREKFSSFACKGEVVQELVNRFDEVSTSHIEFSVLENEAKRTSRSMFKTSDLTSGTILAFRDILSVKGKRVLFSDPNASQDLLQQMLRMDWVPKDPWSWSFLAGAAFPGNREDALLWMDVFRENKLLWVHDNGKLVRAEWDIGPEARIQVYFDPAKGKIPIYCRYIIPINKEEEFGRRSRLLYNEIETEWAEHLRGWVPVRVRNYREALNEKGKVSSSETWSFSIDWNTKLMKDEVLTDSVFELGKVSSHDIFVSFSKGTSPIKD